MFAPAWRACSWPSSVSAIVWVADLGRSRPRRWAWRTSLIAIGASGHIIGCDLYIFCLTLGIPGGVSLDTMNVSFSPDVLLSRR